MQKTIPNLEDSLENLINNQKYSDVHFYIGADRKLFYAHKLVLSLSSKFWEKMFYGLNWKEVANKKVANVEVPDIRYPVFQSLMDYVYTRKYTIKEEDLIDVLLASDKYLIEGLKKLIFEHVRSTTTPIQALTLLDLPEIYFGVPELKDCLIDFLAQTPNALGIKNCLQKRMEDTIKTIFSLEEIHTPEHILFDSLLDWGKWVCQFNLAEPSPSNIHSVISNILPSIRFSHFSQKEFEKVRESQLFDESQLQEMEKNITKSEFVSDRFRRKQKIKSKRIEDIKVLLISAHITPSRAVDIAKSIKSQGIQHVDIFEAMTIQPNLEKMMEYDAVFLFSGYSPYPEKELGDALADYVRAGGGLVFGTVWLMATDLSYSGKINGQIADPKNGFLPFEKANFSLRNRQVLGDYDTSHYIMQGVKNFDLGDGSYYVRVQHSNGNLIASYTSGIPFIGEQRICDDWGTVVILNLYPPSNEEYGDYWISTTDGAKIIANSVAYVAMF